MSSITPVMYRSIFLFAFFAVTQTGEVRSELPWTELLYKIKCLNLKHCIVGYLDHSKSAEKFVSFDQINYKRVNLEDDTLKERRIGKFSFIFDTIVLFRTSFYFDILMGILPQALLCFTLMKMKENIANVQRVFNFKHNKSGVVTHMWGTWMFDLKNLTQNS